MALNICKRALLRVSLVRKEQDNVVNKNGPHRLMYLNVWFPVGGNCLRKIRRRFLLGGGMPLWVSSEVSKAHTFPKTPYPSPSPFTSPSPSPSPFPIPFLSLSLLSCCTSALPSALCHASLHGCHELWPSETTIPKSNAFFYQLPWPWCPFAAIEESLSLMGRCLSCRESLGE